MARIYPFTKKQKDSLDEAAQQEAKEQELFQAAEAFLDTYPFRYAQKQNVYLLPSAGEWLFMKPSSMRERHTLMGERNFAKAVSLTMEDRGWKYQDVTCTYRTAPAGVLNLVSTEGWVQPQAGPHHWLFDVLMQSLGGGKPANITHIEHVIAYKYLHPDCFLLPALLIHGEGGAGKNLLVDVVLYNLFDRQTGSATSDRFLGEFNDLIGGMAAILINEQLPDAEQARMMRDILHKERIAMNPKGRTAYWSDNLPLYFIGSNNPEGGFLLDRSDADRRISVLRVEEGKTLLYWIAKYRGTTIEEAFHWMTNEGNALCRNREEIGKWLTHLIEQHGTKPLPVALHGADYDALMTVQMKIDERLIEAVFGDPEFTHIERRVLYEGYLLLLAHYSQTKYKLSDIRFNRKVKAFLARRKINVTLSTYQFTHTDLRGRRKGGTRFLWVHDEHHDQRDYDNRADYIEEINYRSRWIGPELL